MTTVTLAKKWTDPQGVVHQPGARVEIPDELLDDMVAGGYVKLAGGGDGDAVRFN